MTSYLAVGGVIAGVAGVIAIVLSGGIGGQFRLGVVLAVLGLAALLASIVIQARERRRDSAPREGDE